MSWQTWRLTFSRLVFSVSIFDTCNHFFARAVVDGVAFCSLIVYKDNINRLVTLLRVLIAIYWRRTFCSEIVFFGLRLPNAKWLCNLIVSLFSAKHLSHIVSISWDHNFGLLILRDNWVLQFWREIALRKELWSCVALTSQMGWLLYSTFKSVLRVP